MSEMDKARDAMRDIFKRMGLDPDAVKEQLVEAMQDPAAASAMKLDTKAAETVAMMVDAVTPGAFTIIYDNVDCLHTLGNVDPQTQCMLAMGTVLMHLNKYPDSRDAIHNLIRVGVKNDPSIREVFTVGLDH